MASCVKKFESEAPVAEQEERVMCTVAENSSVYGCALKMEMVAELFITGISRQLVP